jgi:enamine deaminase RidA (YjgF/YER057c/UK114 family)
MWVDSGSKWEAIAGYSRAVRTGNRILVSGTTATHGAGMTVCPGDVEGRPCTSSTRSRVARSARRQPRGCDSHADLHAGRDALGAGRRRARALFRRGAAGQHAAADRALVGDCEVEIEAEAEVGA